MGKVRSSCPKARSSPNAQVVELVDTLASGASARKGVEVQVLSWAPTPNILLQIAYKTRLIIPANLYSTY